MDKQNKLLSVRDLDGFALCPSGEFKSIHVGGGEMKACLDMFCNLLLVDAISKQHIAYRHIIFYLCT